MIFTDALISSGQYFVTLSIELLALFVGISFLVGLFHDYLMSMDLKKRLSKRGRVAGSVIGALFGAITPFCSCSTIPILSGLLNAGVPFGTAMSFLIASPLLNPVIIALMIGLMGVNVAVFYTAFTFTAAVIMGLLLESFGFANHLKTLSSFKYRKRARSKESISQRFRNAASYSVSIFRNVAIYLLAGAAIGAFIHGFVPEETIIAISGRGSIFAVPLAAIVGIPLYIRAETIIPIGTALAEKGMSIGAVMALVIGGAGMSIPEITLLSSMFKKKLLFTFVATVFAIAVIAGFAFNTLI